MSSRYSNFLQGLGFFQYLSKGLFLALTTEIDKINSRQRIRFNWGKAYNTVVLPTYLILTKSKTPNLTKLAIRTTSIETFFNRFYDGQNRRTEKVMPPLKVITIIIIIALIKIIIIISHGWNRNNSVSIQHIILYELSEATTSIVKCPSKLILDCLQEFPEAND